MSYQKPQKVTDKTKLKNLYKLIRIPVEFHRTQTQALLDTGASASFISSEKFATLNNQIIITENSLPKVESFVSANGNVMYPLGHYKIAIKLAPDCTIKQSFFVLPELKEGCILGIDFFKTHETKLDIANKKLSLVVNNKKVVILLKKIVFPIYHVKTNNAISFEISHLHGAERHALSTTLQTHISVFASKLIELGCTKVLKHKIETTGTPKLRGAYRIPVALQPIARQQVEEMLKYNIIRESHSAYRASIVMVKKKSGELRLCVDYRDLNTVTVKDRYPLPRIEDTLNLLHGAKLFSTLDLFSGYWQIEIAEEDIHKTAFTAELGHFEYIRMPFGLCNAPSTFQRTMEIIFKPLIGKCVMVYIDDIIVYSKTMEEHVEHLTLTFRLLQTNGLKVKIQKCRFAAPEVEYLGHVVSEKGVKVDPKKIKSVHKYPAPKNVDQVRAFLGLANYYRRFIEQFADKVHVLTMLTRSKVTWQWGQTEESAFNGIKDCLCSAPTLAYPDFARPFILHTDACGYGVGGVLSQLPNPIVNQGSNEESFDDSYENRDESQIDISKSLEHPIAYTSKHLTDVQIKWCTTEKEAYAIIHSVKAFFHYLYGANFTIVTDHRPLQYIQRIREPTGRLARWFLFLQQFDMKIEYRPGKLHQNADALSRIPINIIVSQKIVVDDWLVAQQEDKFCQEATKKNTNATLGLRITVEDDFQYLPSGLLTTASGQIVVPAKLRQEIMEQYHDHKLAGHLGVIKTLANIRNKYFWPRMASEVKIHVLNCLTCAKRKASGACKAPLQPIPISDYIWERLAMDIVGPVPESNRGNRYILVIMEYTTRYIIATALKEISAATIIRKFIKHIVNDEGLPSQILTDRGSNFQSIAMQELCKQLGVKQLRTTAYHPQTDGAVERFNRTLGDMLTAHVYQNPSIWDDHLDYVVAAYNRTPHSSTGETPFYLLKGRDALEPTDLRPPMRNRLLEDQNNIFTQQWQEAVELAKSKLIVAQSRQKWYYDRSLKECSFEPNDQVLLEEMKSQTGKFYMRWDGPFTIVEKLSDLNYLIRRSEGNHTVVVHVNRLKKWKKREESENWGEEPSGIEEPIGNLREKPSESEEPVSNPQEKTDEREGDGHEANVENNQTGREQVETTTSDNTNLARSIIDKPIQSPKVTQQIKVAKPKRKNRAQPNVEVQPRRSLRIAVKQPNRLITEM